MEEIKTQNMSLKALKKINNDLKKRNFNYSKFNY